MIHIDPERLRSVGLAPVAAQALLQLDLPAEVGDARAFRVIEVHRETLRLHDGRAVHEARVHPRAVRALADEGTAVAVGDWVVGAADVHGGALWVQAVAPRTTHLARPDADGRRHPVVSNVDTALIVMGLDDDYNPRRLERFSALVQGSGVLPVVVLSKADAVGAGTLALRLDELCDRLPRGMDVQAVNTREPAAAQALAPYLGAGQTLALIGSSGAGKSTLTNTLLGAAVQDTGAVREHDSRGKHTTTSRSLHRLPGGACVIDTPGLRTLRPDVDEQALAATFDDIGALARACRFRDCTHGGEPGCAVRAGVDADRLKNFHKLMREARRDTMSALDRQRQISEWKLLTRAGRERSRAKRA